jgi:glycosyltransferase involved in cell wall biosynthesis
MHTTDLVSIIVTTRNSARTLAQCLDSIAAQSYPHIETIVVDNHSTDKTVDIAAASGARVLHAGPERSAQRNAGIRQARGLFVFIADSDMAFDPNVIAECVREIESANAVAVPEVSHGEGFWTACKTFERSFYTNDATVSAARFFRKDDALRAGGYDVTLLGGEDWDLSMRIVAGGRLAFTHSVIRHDEGRIGLAQSFIKKRYYGAGVRRFLAKHGAEGWKRMSPSRGGIFKQPLRLATHPFLTAGMLFLKSVEAAGLLLGMADARAHDIDRVYRPQ